MVSECDSVECVRVRIVMMSGWSGVREPSQDGGYVCLCSCICCQYICLCTVVQLYLLSTIYHLSIFCVFYHNQSLNEEHWLTSLVPHFLHQTETGELVRLTTCLHGCIPCTFPPPPPPPPKHTVVRPLNIACSPLCLMVLLSVC